jgi:hypothetical protein
MTKLIFPIARSSTARSPDHRPPGFNRHRIKGNLLWPPAPSLATNAPLPIIYLHHRHQLALERAGVPFRQRSFASARGQADAQTRNPGALRLAITKARSWIDDVASGCVRSFAEIAEREGKVERHIRLLTPLAFVPPRTLTAIIDGTGPHDATVTALAQSIPYRWDRSPD